MAILGFLAHTLEGQAHTVEKALAAMPELTTYGVHKACYVVTVAEAATDHMGALVDRVKNVEGVLTVYVTSFTREDEEEDAPVVAAGVRQRP
ncbi:MAG: chaperone NapD [Desulfovibrionaceae bacterium]|nr:chaperone NapD [Desulfovibrionaceae bacterium]